ncbi:phosphoribosylaminoimidazolesuccinocarboxamide synthase, partial [Candidatus Aerophobetes bacterium]
MTQSHLAGIEVFKRGKVRDIYDLGDRLLIVATDRVSAFDCILPDPIPFKGKVLTALSSLWFNRTRNTIPNHLITTNLEDYPSSLLKFRDTLEGRSMLVKRSEVVKIECVVRGYLAGSAYMEYQNCGSICGITLPSGLREADPLPEPIFTPATKEASGHDINITREKMGQLIGNELAERLAEISLKIYKRAGELLKPRRIIISDTKFEFGFLDGELILIDELLTPDSSRFWSTE